MTDAPPDLVARYRLWVSTSCARLAALLHEEGAAVRGGADALGEAHELAHSFAGVAGSFGDSLLGDLGRALARYLRARAPADCVAADLAAFAEALAKIDAEPDTRLSLSMLLPAHLLARAVATPCADSPGSREPERD